MSLFSAVENMGGVIAPVSSERKAPWDFLKGVKDVSSATSVEEAMVMGGLNWPVIQRRTFFSLNDVLIDTGRVANVRADNGVVLGMVSNDYSLVQNEEAFDILSYISSEQLKLERAGSFGGGRIAFMEAIRPETLNLMGNAIDRFVLFVNTFDGSGTMKIIFTNIRIVCKNTLNAAIRGAQRYLSVLHRGNIGEKIEDVRKLFAAAEHYDNLFIEDAETLAKIHVSREGINRILDVMFPMVDPVDQKRKFDNMLRLRDTFIECYNASDLYDFRGTAWAVYNGFADMVSHNKGVIRLTEKTAERPMLAAVNGSAMLDRVHAMLLEQSVA